MTLIVEYLGEKFSVVLEEIDRFLIATLLDWKEKKCNIPEVEKLLYEKWVLKRDVTILGERDKIGLSRVML